MTFVLQLMYITNTPINIVLTDDDHDDRDLFTEALSNLNFKTNLTTYPDCESMLSGLLKDKTSDLPAVIFLDINMPGKNGLESLGEIKKDIRYKKVPVVMFTTSVRLKDVQDARKLGADLFLNKPSDFTELISMLNKLITPAGFKITSAQGVS